MMHPLYSPVPLTDVPREVLKKHIKVTVPSRQAMASASQTGFFLPVPKITYAHAKGCIYSTDPEFVIQSAKAVETADEFGRMRLANITALLDVGIDGSLHDDDGSREIPLDLEGDEQVDSQPHLTTSASSPPSTTKSVWDGGESEARKLLIAERIRLEQGLATGSLAKGLYFKRCNGEWRNGLDHVLVRDKESPVTEHEKATRARQLRGESISDSEHENMIEQGVVDIDSTPTSPRPSSRNTRTSSFSSLSSSLSSSKASPTSRSSLSSNHGYGYAVLNKQSDELARLGSSASSISFWSSPSSSKSMRLSNATSFFTFTTHMLQNREALVGLGQVDDEDLCRTCWGYNRIAKRARSSNVTGEEEKRSCD